MELTKLKADRKFFSKIGLIMFFASIIFNVIQIIASLIASNIPGISDNYNLTFIVQMVPTYVIGYPIIFLIMRKLPRQLTTEKKSMRPLHILIAFLICYAFTYVCNYIGTIITTVIGTLKQSEVDNVILDLTSQINPFVNLLIIVIAAPIMEELLFRKFLIDRTAHYGEGVSILLSGLMFGLFHGNLAQFMYAFVLGACFGFIYIKTRNIIYPIILHMITNFLGGFVSSILLEVSGYAELLETLASPVEPDPDMLMSIFSEHAIGLIFFIAYAMILIHFVIAGIVLFFVNKRKIHFNPGEITIEKGERFKTIILNVGMILYCIFWIIMIIWQLLA